MEWTSLPLTAGRLTVRFAAVLPLLASVILLFAEFWNPARFTIPYLLMAGLPISTWSMAHVKKD